MIKFFGSGKRMSRQTIALPHMVAWYWLMGLMASVLAYLLAGGEAGKSALWGAVAVALPNTFFALWLMLRGRFPGGGVAFLLGEALKVAAILLFVWKVTQLEPHLHWLPFLIGMALTAKAGWIGLLLTTFGSNHGGICCRTDGV
jgi:ATP synthase protein I